MPSGPAAPRLRAASAGAGSSGAPCRSTSIARSGTIDRVDRDCVRSSTSPSPEIAAARSQRRRPARATRTVRSAPVSMMKLIGALPAHCDRHGEARCRSRSRSSSSRVSYRDPKRSARGILCGHSRGPAAAAHRRRQERVAAEAAACDHAHASAHIYACTAHYTYPLLRSNLPETYFTRAASPRRRGFRLHQQGVVGRALRQASRGRS